MRRIAGKAALLPGIILLFYLSGTVHELNPRLWGQETEHEVKSAPVQADIAEKAQLQDEKTKSSPEQGEKAQAQETVPETEEIHARPKDIREATGIFVFLGWLWLSIFVMIYLLRQKIKETDRLYSFRYFTGAGKGPSETDQT